MRLFSITTMHNANNIKKTANLGDLVYGRGSVGRVIGRATVGGEVILTLAYAANIYFVPPIDRGDVFNVRESAPDTLIVSE